VKAFFKEKGLYLICLALVFAATVTGIMAIRSVVNNVAEWSKAQQKAMEEDDVWTVTNPVTDVPEPTAVPSAQPSASPAPATPSPAPADSSAQDGAPAAASAPQGGLSGTPLADKAVAAFSGDELVYNETLGDWRTHNGADYTGTVGQKVAAGTAGQVIAVYEDALWGHVVELADKNGTLWRYCGLDEPAVALDDKVALGDTLGALGDLPAEAHLGAHLHLECLKEGVYCDPENER